MARAEACREARQDMHPCRGGSSTTGTSRSWRILIVHEGSFMQSPHSDRMIVLAIALAVGCGTSAPIPSNAGSPETAMDPTPSATSVAEHITALDGASG